MCKDIKASSLLVAEALGLSTVLDATSIKESQVRVEKQEKLQQQIKESKHCKAATLAKTIVSQSAITKEVPYLVGKGLADCEVLTLQKLVENAGKILNQGLLVIPLYNEHGELTTCQLINDSGYKYLLAGGQKAGSFHRIVGSESDVLAICEGLATGLSVHKATGYTVYCAIDAGNLRRVAEIVRKKYPQAEIILAADNDSEHKQNIGLIKATDAASSIGGQVLFPPILGDWNDYHQQYGLDKTRDALQLNSRCRKAITSNESNPEPKSQIDNTKPRIERQGLNLFYVIPKLDKETGDISEISHWLCSSMNLIGRGRDEDGSYFRMIQWKENGAGIERIDAFPMELVGEREGWARMRRGGLSVTTSHTLRAHLGNHMQLAGEDKLWRVVSRSGWQHGAYVLPNAEVIGCSEEQVFFNGRSASANAYRVKGSIQNWRDMVGQLALGNECMMLGVACSLAAPLLDLIEADSFGVHLFGNSGTGKTTIGMVANSVWGHPEELKLSWYSTALGLANEAAAHNDGLMSLDEIGQSTRPKDVATSVYTLFNGVGKIQGAKDGGNREAMRWRVLALSTGEKDLETFLYEAGENVHAGHLVRLLNVPIQPIAKLHGYSDSRSHADAIQQAVKGCYGILGREWVNYLADHKEQLISTIQTITSIWQKSMPVEVSDQVRRVVNRFAILEAALIMSSHLTGWSEKQSKDAVLHCFNEWVAMFGIENRERRSVIDQVVAFLNSNGKSRYSVIVRGCETPCDDGAYLIRDLAGYRLLESESPERWIYFTFPHVFEKEVSKGFNPRMVAKILYESEMLKRDASKSAGFTKRTPRISGRQARCYALTFAVDKDANQEGDFN